MSLLVEPEPLFPAGEAEEIELQLSRLLESHHFARSSRYPALLQFLVQQVQIGNAARLKERHIGIKVFHRALDYDTGSDPIVRVTAGEVRKRIAQYYQEPQHQGELRIDLPLGSYVPRFLPARLAAHSVITSDHAAAQNEPETHTEPLPVKHKLAEPADDAHSSDLVGALEATSGREQAVLSSVTDEAHSMSPASTVNFTRPRVAFLLLATLLLGAGVASGPIALSALRDAVRTRALHRLWAPMETRVRCCLWWVITPWTTMAIRWGSHPSRQVRLKPF